MVLLIYEPPHDKTNKMTVRQAKTDQPGHLPSLISPRFPHEESLGPELPTERTAKTLIRPGGCAGHTALGTQSFCRFCHQSLSTRSEYILPVKCCGYMIKHFTLQNTAVSDSVVFNIVVM